MRVSGSDQLKAVIDQLPEGTLAQVGLNLAHFLAPRKPRLEMEHMERRMKDYKGMVEQRINEQHLAETHQSRATGWIGGGGGGRGMMGMHEGVPFGRYGFQFWDKQTLIHRSLLSYGGQELEVTERLSISPDHMKLFCDLELSSGGRTVCHTEEFAIMDAEGQ